MIKPKYQPNKTILAINKSTQGERLEMKIERILNNKEPIKDGAPIIYTERSEGVRPEMDIRTNRFELAIEAMDTVSRSHMARREEFAKSKEKPKGEDTGGEPIQTTNGNPE